MPQCSDPGSFGGKVVNGAKLQEIRVNIAQSYERIHCSNLVFTGLAPLQLMKGESLYNLKVNGAEIFNITGNADMRLQGSLLVKAIKDDGSVFLASWQR